MRRYLEDTIGPARSLLDVSCGDDSSLQHLATTRGMTCVGCDIALPSVAYLARKYPALHFCCSDIHDLPFHRPFDVVLVKNTLHHLPKGQQAVHLLRNLLQLSQRLIIVDVLDPLVDSPRAVLWHYYYRYVLRDDAANFYTQQELVALLTDAVGGGATVEYTVLPTFKGTYLAAHLKRCPSNGHQSNA
ncbi:MAG TPA: methyltransferase domain-containing protein [Herpetosiphonaceae bacterium]|nr:methyltransferase domain-containing protein [Herpetosiphonaceae bacterium]